MRRRYYIVAVCLLVMSFLLTACGGKEKDKKVTHIQIAYENNTDEPLSKACEKWKELLEEKSNGEFQVDLYPSSQLGTKNDIINQAIAGDSVITLENRAFYSDLGVKDFGVVFAPYFFLLFTKGIVEFISTAPSCQVIYMGIQKKIFCYFLVFSTFNYCNWILQSINGSLLK